MKNRHDAYVCEKKLRELEARIDALERRVDAYHSPRADGSVAKEEVDIAAFLESYSMQGR